VNADFYTNVYVNGIRIDNNTPYITECDGRLPEQQWTQPTSISTDLRLQSSLSNLCLDTCYPLQVCVSFCDTASWSQQWMYDGRNILSKANPSFCLDIHDDQTTLKLSRCNYRPTSTWMEHSISPWTTGNVIRGGTYLHMLCPMGSKVKHVGVPYTLSAYFQMICDDQFETKIGPPNPDFYIPFQWIYCYSGLTMADVSFTNAIRRTNYYCPTTESWLFDPISSNENNRNVSHQYISLTGDQRIIGFQMYYSNDYIQSISFLYQSMPSSYYAVNVRNISRPLLPILYGCLGILGIGLLIVLRRNM